MTEEIHVINPPKAGFSISPVCLHDTSRFVDASTRAVSYKWKFGNGTSDTSRSPKYVYPQAGTYNAALTITSPLGCADSVTQQVTVWDLPTPSFSVDSVCHPAVSQFMNTSKADTNATYQWSFGDSKSSILRDPQHQYAAIGNYPVTLLVSNVLGGCHDSVVGMAKVHPTPSLNFSIKDIKGTEKEFSPSETSGLTFIWHFGDGDSSTSVSPVHTYPSSNADYTVKMLATNVHGCSLERTALAKVWPNGMEYWEDHGISVYPNPFSERIIISPDGTQEPVNLSLYSATGQLMMTVSVNGNERIELATDALPAGVYLLKSSNSQASYSTTLIKE